MRLEPTRSRTPALPHRREGRQPNQQHQLHTTPTSHTVQTQAYSLVGRIRLSAVYQPDPCTHCHAARQSATPTTCCSPPRLPPVLAAACGDGASPWGLPVGPPLQVARAALVTRVMHRGGRPATRGPRQSALDVADASLGGRAAGPARHRELVSSEPAPRQSANWVYWPGRRGPVVVEWRNAANRFAQCAARSAQRHQTNFHSRVTRSVLCCACSAAVSSSRCPVRPCLGGATFGACRPAGPSGAALRQKA